MKKDIEKIRDDLYVKKGKFGYYSIVYPVKNEDGSMNWKNMKKALFSDLWASLPYLLAVGVLLYLLLPGAMDIKEECQEAINDCVDNSCDICVEQQDKGYGDFGLNLSIGNEGVENEKV